MLFNEVGQDPPKVQHLPVSSLWVRLPTFRFNGLGIPGALALSRAHFSGVAALSETQKELQDQKRWNCPPSLNKVNMLCQMLLK